MTPQGYFNGIKVFVTENCVTSVPRRKHKKRRIQKKWLKRYGKTFKPFKLEWLTEVGKTVFLTKEEAEQKLKELNKNV